MSEGTTVVNINDVAEEELESGEVVYVGYQRGPAMWRGGYYLPRSPWRNPYNKEFREGRITRKEAHARYEAYLLGSPELLARLPELRGKRLACWCSPGACHADVLVRLADGA